MKKIFLLIICFISLIEFNVSAQTKEDRTGIAPDFSNFKGTLLVLENRDFRDNTLNRMTKKRFDKFYKGEYEMITTDDFESKSYRDTIKYRFVVQLRNSRSVSGVHSGAGSSGRGAGDNFGSASDATKFVMTDRVTKKEYNTLYYPNWVTIIKKYPKELEDVRAK